MTRLMYVWSEKSTTATAATAIPATFVAETVQNAERMPMDELEQFDAFDLVSNADLEEAYYQCVRENDPDREHLEKEMVRRGLLGSC